MDKSMSVLKYSRGSSLLLHILPLKAHDRYGILISLNSLLMMVVSSFKSHHFKSERSVVQDRRIVKTLTYKHG
jgi:hypothetical protein